MNTSGHSVDPISEQMVPAPKTLPYRWGYFQGSILIPWSLLVLLGSFASLSKTHDYPVYYTAVEILMAVLGVPLGFGLLWKRKFALILIHVMFGLTLLLTAIQIPRAIAHAADQGYRGSAFPEAEMLLVWLLSLVYYRRRRTQFH